MLALLLADTRLCSALFIIRIGDGGCNIELLLASAAPSILVCAKHRITYVNAITECECALDSVDRS